jgi:ribosome-binding protein aMBF1 (putative translation factor)
VYSNETQSPWSLSHLETSITWVKPGPPSKSSKPDRADPASSRPSVRQRASEDIRTHPLYLQNLFATNVRLVRMARGLSQEELADRASLDRTYISSIERRLRNLSIQNIQRLALALQVDPRELLDPGLINDARYRD